MDHFGKTNILYLTVFYDPNESFWIPSLFKVDFIFICINPSQKIFSTLSPRRCLDSPRIPRNGSRQFSYIVKKTLLYFEPNYVFRFKFVGPKDIFYKVLICYEPFQVAMLIYYLFFILCLLYCTGFE